MSMWSRWVAFSSREHDARPLALVRILVCSVLVVDLLQVARLGLVTELWRDFEHGGIGVTPASGLWLDAWPTWGGPIAFGLIVLALVAAALGVGTRPAILVAIVLYAQLGHIFPPADRAIDRILRTTLLVLLFSGAHRRFALGGGPSVMTIPAWPADLLRWLLVLVYLSAGLHKLNCTPDWLGSGDPPVLMRILANPLAGRIDPQVAASLIPLWRLGGLFTIVLELSSPLILTRFAPWWALAGLGLHLGIAATMNLGMFSWGMMALYPVLFLPWFVDGPPWRRRHPAPLPGRTASPGGGPT